MSYFSFDYFGLNDIPIITLANPDGTELYILGNGIEERKVQLRFNALSTFTFVAHAYINGIKQDFYDFLDYRRLVFVDSVCNFMITEVEIKGDGIDEYKNISCQSLETIFNFKKISALKQEFKFYDFDNRIGTLFQYIKNFIPDWTIGYVSFELISLYRYFEVTDATLYDFMQNTVAQAFQCIFIYDSINKTISAYTIADAKIKSDIFMSFNNLIQDISVKEISGELVTALNVFGANNLSIAQVNPLGTDTIYNLKYYKTDNWMSARLQTSLTNWENKISSNQVTYADLMRRSIEENAILLEDESTLARVQGELLALQDVQKARIQGNIKDDIDFTDPYGVVWKNTDYDHPLNAAIKSNESQTIRINSTIRGDEDVIKALIDQLKGVNGSLSFENNFTPSELNELNYYIIGSTYTNTNFTKFDNMSERSIQEQAQELYNDAQTVLTKLSVPRFTFDVNSINFGMLQEFQTFIDQLVLGCTIALEYRDGSYIYPVLLGIDFSYDNPEEFKLTFSNRLRLDDSSFQLSDLLNSAVNSGVTTSFNSQQWSSWNDQYKNDVTSFINSALDTSKNMVTSGSNQEITISSVGMRGRQKLDNGDYQDKQFWFINNMLAFTRDSWDTAALALGEIKTPSGLMAYGIVKDKLLSQIVSNEGKNLNIR